MHADMLRLITPLVVAVLLLLGTWRGDDDNFPFGPFRMYSTAQRLDGEVRSLQLWALDDDGQWRNVLTEDFGLRRADLEGQIGRQAVPPRVVLRHLAATYRRLHGEFPFRALQLRLRIYELRGGQPASERLEVIGVWRATSESSAERPSLALRD
ncbi:MAG: hypothetical protein M3161_03150 [Actinomycetota bacterium]|nr:hypothetical protein [Actinomycetota bacterium]